MRRMWRTARALRLGASIAGFILLGACSSAPAVDVSRENAAASIIASSCTGCHAAGLASGAIPVLAGRRAETLEKQMRAYRDGTRGGTLMPRLLAGYTDEQLAELANFFSARARAKNN